MKSASELILEFDKKEILENIPKYLEKINSSFDINLNIDNLNLYIIDYDLNIPRLYSKWIIVDNQLFYIMMIYGNEVKNIFYLTLANKNRIFESVMLNYLIRNHEVIWNV